MRLTVNPFFTVSRTDGWKIRSLPSFYDREVFISSLEENKERPIWRDWHHMVYGGEEFLQRIELEKDI